MALPVVRMIAAPQGQSTADLMKLPTREFIMIASKDGAGKSCALVALASWVQNALDPAAVFNVIDTENKFPTALKSFGSDAPTNINYFKCENMNDVTDATDHILQHRKMGDWLAVESMSRIWERSQDLGYQAVSGFTKAAYLEKRREANKSAPVIPKPDDFWNVVKGAHDSAFLDLISQASSLNAILTTTISKPPKAGGFIKENETRKEARIEFGMDAGIDGAPRIPYFVETLCLLDVKNGKVTCRVVRDNNATSEESRKEFDVDGRKTWGQNFWINCRS
jgi:hypothetical protein